MSVREASSATLTFAKSTVFSKEKICEIDEQGNIDLGGWIFTYIFMFRLGDKDYVVENKLHGEPLNLERESAWGVLKTVGNYLVNGAREMRYGWFRTLRLGPEFVKNVKKAGECRISFAYKTSNLGEDKVYKNPCITNNFTDDWLNDWDCFTRTELAFTDDQRKIRDAIRITKEKEEKFGGKIYEPIHFEHTKETSEDGNVVLKIPEMDIPPLVLFKRKTFGSKVDSSEMKFNPISVSRLFPDQSSLEEIKFQSNVRLLEKSNMYLELSRKGTEFNKTFGDYLKAVCLLSDALRVSNFERNLGIIGMEWVGVNLEKVLLTDAGVKLELESFLGKRKDR